MSKVIERFGHFQLYGHLIITQNNLLFDKQFALDNVATTATAFCQFTDDLPVVCAADWCEESHRAFVGASVVSFYIVVRSMDNFPDVFLFRI